MYFNEKGNTDIDDNLRYKSHDKTIVNKKKIRKYVPYIIFALIYILGIILIIIGSKL